MPTPTSPLLRSALPIALGIAAMATLAGCASVTAPPMRDAAAVRVGLAPDPAVAPVERYEAPQSADAWAPWPSDPVLSQLLTEARSNSPGLQAARARLDAARAQAGLTGLNAAPSGTLSARATETRLSTVEADPYDQGAPRPPRRSILQAGLAIGWELDLFGRVGTAKAIAERGVDAEAAALAGAEALLEAELVRLYALYRERASALDSLDQAMRASEQRRRDLAARIEAGLAEAPQGAEAEIEHRALQAAHAVAEAEHRDTRNRLLAAAGISPLLDHPVRRLLESPGAVPTPPAAGGYRLPADFLERRPDVLAADARLRAAIGETVLAERADWPSLTLLGTLASVASGGGLGNASSLSSVIGPSIEWHWFDFGRNRLREAAARAGEQASAADFEATVLRAVAEADSAIRAWEASRQAWEDTVAAAAAADRILQRAQVRADTGLEPRIVATTARLAALDAHRQAERAKAESLAAYATLRLALGVDAPANGRTAGSGVPHGIGGERVQR